MCRRMLLEGALNQNRVKTQQVDRRKTHEKLLALLLTLTLLLGTASALAANLTLGIYPPDTDAVA